MSYMEAKFDKVKLRHFRDCIKSKIVIRQKIYKTQAFLFDRLMVTTYHILIDENQICIHFKIRHTGMC